MESIRLDGLLPEIVPISEDTWNHPLRHDNYYGCFYRPPALEDIEHSILETIKKEGNRLGKERFKKFDPGKTFLSVAILEEMYMAVSRTITAKIYEYTEKNDDSSVDKFMEIRNAFFNRFKELGIFAAQK